MQGETISKFKERVKEKIDIQDKEFEKVSSEFSVVGSHARCSKGTVCHCHGATASFLVPHARNSKVLRGIRRSS